MIRELPRRRRDREPSLQLVTGQVEPSSILVDFRGSPPTAKLWVLGRLPLRIPLI